jgi:hypothetical protein
MHLHAVQGAPGVFWYAPSAVPGQPVVSKEQEVAVGRKGSGGVWGSTSRNAGLAGPANPAKWSNTNTGTKSRKTFDRWAVGCTVVVLKMTCSQSGCKVQTHFLAPPVRAIRGA